MDLIKGVIAQAILKSDEGEARGRFQISKIQELCVTLIDHAQIKLELPNANFLKTFGYLLRC